MCNLIDQLWGRMKRVKKIKGLKYQPEKISNHPINSQIAASRDTDLHRLVLKSPNLVDFEAKLKEFDENKLYEMAITVNDRGSLPLDLLKWSSMIPAEKQKISALLFNWMQKTQIMPHQALIDVKKIENDYKNQYVDKQLIKNIKIACEVANEIRQQINFSDTHPDCNTISNEENSAIRSKVTNVRIGYRYWGVISSLFHPIDACLDPEGLQYKTVTSIAKQHKAGNCLEYCHLVKFRMQEKYKETPVQILNITNGDHIIACIGEGDNQVICDAWSGKVYPYTTEELCKHLLCFEYRVDEQSGLRQEPKRILKRYNPNYHQIVKDDSLNAMVAENRYLLGCLGIFAAFSLSKVYNYLMESSNPSKKIG